MDASLFWRGLVLGFSIAAPVGPIGVLCIRRTLAEGWLYGLVSGLGAATADAAYGSVAAFGLTVVSGLLLQQQGWLRLIGGLFLLYLGVTTLLARPPADKAESTPPRLTGAYLSTLALTLTNPLTILSFAAVFAGLGFGTGASSGAGAGLLVAGVFLGSAAWWLLLSVAVSALRARPKTLALVWVNRVSGVMIVGFGAAVLGSLLAG